MAYSGPNAWYLNYGNGSSTGHYAVAAWTALTVYAAGALVRQLAAPAVGSERVFVCIIAGTSLASEPTWTVTKGAKTAEAAGPTWQECTGQPGLNGDPGSTTTATSAITAAGSAVLTFSAVPTNIRPGMTVFDNTAPTVIPANTTVLSTTATTVTMSANATGGGVGNGDAIVFSYTPSWTASSTPALGLIIYDPATASLQICSTSGAGSASKPSFSATAGTTTADTSATWTSLGVSSGFTTIWGAPFARLQSCFGTGWVAAGNYVWTSAAHAETQAATMTVTSAGTAASPNLVYCVANAPSLNPPAAADVTTGAQVTTTGAFAMTIKGAGTYYNGLKFSCGSGATNVSLNLGPDANGGFIRCDNCTITKPGTTGGAQILIGNQVAVTVLDNTTIQFGATNDQFVPKAGTFLWRNTASAIQGATIPNPLVYGATAGQDVTFQAVDLSAIVGTLAANGINLGLGLTLLDCKLSSTVAMVTQPWSTASGNITIVSSDSAGTNYRKELHNFFGSLTTDTVVIRSGGASNGTTAVADKILTTANAAFLTPFRSIPIAIWNATTGTNRVVTILGVMNAAALPFNDQVWMEATYFGSGSTPIGTLATNTKTNGLAQSLTAVTADSTSNWASLATARANTAAYVVGNTISVSSNSSRIFFCTGTGTSSGSLPAGYASAVDGGSVTDGGATFRAGVRFSLAVTLSAPQPQLLGPIYVTALVGVASTTVWIDPLIVLS